MVCLDSFEEDEEGGVWKVITTAWFENVEEIKKALGKMKKYNWLFLSDSSILFEGKEIYCDGRMARLKKLTANGMGIWLVHLFRK